VLVLLGIAITGYTADRAILSWTLYRDPVGTSVFAFGALFLLLCTLFLLYIGIAYAFGELRSVVGGHDSATLIGASGVVANAVPIRFSRIVHPTARTRTLRTPNATPCSSWAGDPGCARSRRF
jgi:hypothetical protein